MGEFLMGELFEKGPVRRKDVGTREAKDERICFDNLQTKE